MLNPVFKRNQVPVIKVKEPQVTWRGRDRSRIVKNGGKELIQRLWKVISRVWETEEIPEDWKTAMLCPIYKKGDRKDCNNYRGTVLLNVAYKIFTNLILSRIKETAEGLVGDYQGGFRLGRSATDQIFIVRQLLQKNWEFKNEMHLYFCTCTFYLFPKGT